MKISVRWIIYLLVLLIVFLIMFLSCDRTILLPSDDIAQTEIANILITFDFKAQTIAVHNSNKEGAEVEIRRWNDDTKTYLKIFHEGVGGYSEVIRGAEFDHGENIKIRIKIEGQELTRYYTLGAPWLVREWLIEREPDWETIIIR